MSLENNKPLKPGFIRQFGYVVPECPSECVASKVTLRVTGVKFADQDDAHSP